MTEKKNDRGHYENRPALQLINICNTQLNNPAEYTIARAILSLSDEKETITLSRLAEMANTSEASVSRFIRKCGYASFQDFRQNYQLFMVQLRLSRKVEGLRTNQTRDYEEIAQIVYNRMKYNIERTKENVKPERLMDLIHRFRNASSVTFLGDDHTLSDFYTLQLDLLAAGIPSYLFKNREFQKIHAKSLQPGDLLVYLNVHTDFMTSTEKKIMLDLHEKGVALVGMYQEEPEGMTDLFDDLILYGAAGSKNDGFVSLWYLSRTLSELFSASL